MTYNDIDGRLALQNKIHHAGKDWEHRIWGWKLKKKYGLQLVYLHAASFMILTAESPVHAIVINPFWFTFATRYTSLVEPRLVFWRNAVASK